MTVVLLHATLRAEQRTRRNVVRRYIEDYVAEHEEMPTGRRDFGVVRIRSGLTHVSPISVGAVDFDRRR